MPPDTEFQAVIRLLEGELKALKDKLTWVLVLLAAIAVQAGITLAVP